MTDNMNQRRQLECEDAVLGLLMEEYAEIEGEALWREFQAAQAAGNGPQAPQREDRNVSRGSIDQNRRLDFLNYLGNGFRRAAVIFLVLVCLLSPLIMSVEAFKLPVLNYIVALERKFLGFTFGKNEHLSEKQEEVLKVIQSEPCPDGYEFLDHQTTSNGKIRLDLEHEGRIAMSISIYPSAGQINIDTEDITQTSMKIYDYEAVYLQKDGHRLMWMDAEREMVFDLRAFELGEEAFWRYAYLLTEKLSQ